MFLQRNPADNTITVDAKTGTQIDDMKRLMIICVNVSYENMKATVDRGTFYKISSFAGIHGKGTIKINANYYNGI